jgi:sec-independent protein translocase protein TatA
MGNVGIWQIVIIVALIVIFFGRGKISSIMGDFARGIKGFKKEMSDDQSVDKKDPNDKDQNSKSNH